MNGKEKLLYQAPQATIVEIKTQAIICQSNLNGLGTDTDPYEDRF